MYSNLFYEDVSAVKRELNNIIDNLGEPLKWPPEEAMLLERLLIAHKLVESVEQAVLDELVDYKDK